MSEQWWMYLLECEGDMTYVGTAADVEKRFAKHISGKGSRFTRINKPIMIIAAQPFPDRSTACKAEYALKQRPLQQKLDWAEEWSWVKSS